MKPLLLMLPLILICGCGTIGAVRSAVFGDPNIDPEDKIEYAKQIEDAKAALDKLKAEQAQFMVFQYLAVGLIIAGGGMVVLSKTKTSIGIGFILVGFVSSGWGLTATKHPNLVIGLMIAGLILGGLYLAQGLFRRKSN